MQGDSLDTFSPFNVAQAAREFLGEVGGTTERKKKTIPSPEGLQTFFLYIQSQAYVPPHYVRGPITVQAIIGDARLSAVGQLYDLPEGSIVFLAAEVSHDVSASNECVLLVTHALQD
jgi:quercetin dioxygenase-like cupin family protein